MGKKKTAASRKKANRVKTVGQDEGEVEVPVGPKKIFLPGTVLPEPEDGREGEWELEPDMSAYVMLRGWQTEWPCLSFDILRDGGGEERTGFPMTSYMVAGSQAGDAGNQLMVMRLANLHRNGRDEPVDGDDDDDDSGEDEEEEGKRPHFSVASIPHPGCVNRVRTHRSHPSVLTATWSESGSVHIWGLGEAYKLVEGSPTGGGDKTFNLRVSPLHTVSHGVEGYALDWNRSSRAVSLLSGDCNGRIALTQVDANAIHTEAGHFQGHTGSVEDLQWSPTEATVFASCSTDGTVRLWDTRAARTSAALAHRVSDVDVNVISWNGLAGNLLASGDDSGRFATWDLRTISTPLYTSDWHKDAITSIEWSPTDASVLAVSGADDQCSLWDFAVEADPAAEPDSMEADREIPAQLLFIHQGQRWVKELHWHPQLSGVLVSTAGSGFNILKTISV